LCYRAFPFSHLEQLNDFLLRNSLEQPVVSLKGRGMLLQRQVLLQVDDGRKVYYSVASTSSAQGKPRQMLH
jgi:hypothetical protein